MIIVKEGSKYKVKSNERYYIVDPEKNSCSCPHYRFRMAKINGLCKHLQAVKDKLEQRDKEAYDDILSYVKKRHQVPSIELLEKFSEQAVDDLICRGELAEEKGMIRILH